MAAEIITIRGDALALRTQWIAERDEMLAEAAGVTHVEAAPELQTAGSLLAKLKGHRKALEAERKAVTAPIDNAKAQIMAQERELAAALEAETARVKALCDSYATREAARVEAIRQEEARKLREAEEKRAREEAEARRKAAEEMAKANAEERARIAQEEAARQAKAAAERAAEEAAARAKAAAAPKAPTTTANRIVTRWTVEVVDPLAVPKAFCTPDVTRIRQYMQTCVDAGQTPEMAGVRFVRTESVESRGR